MIRGSDVFYKLMYMLEHLDLGYRPAFTSEVMNYAVRYSGHTMQMWDSNLEDDELEPTEAEKDIILMMDDPKAYADMLDDILLGEEDE